MVAIRQHVNNTVLGGTEHIFGFPLVAKVFYFCFARHKTDTLLISQLSKF